MSDTTPTGSHVTSPPDGGVVDDLMAPAVYSRAAGTRDLDPEAAARRDRIERRLLETFACYGFQRVDVPTLEYRDLYSPARIGPDLFHHLVMARLPISTSFPPEGHSGEAGDDELGPLQGNAGTVTHDAALRPDFTAPLARMLVTRMLAGDGVRRELPARWSYAGAVFRARAPRPLRLLEFHQVGVELLGAAHPLADLEVVSLACDAVTRLDVPDWRLHLGHAELFKALVELAGPRDAAASSAIANGLVLAARMRMRASFGDDGFARYVHGARHSLVQRVRDFLSGPGGKVDARLLSERMAASWPELVAPDALSLDDWRTVLPVLNERLLVQMWAEDHGLPPDRGDALLELARSSGPANTFFSAVGGFVAAMSECGHVSREAQRNVDTLRAAFHDLTRDLTRDLRDALGRRPPVYITPAASRGIAYYTGITFEIHTPRTGSAYTDICGGGRYSELHEWLHGRATQTAAHRRGSPGTQDSAPSAQLKGVLTGVGFAFGVERLDAALRGQKAQRPKPDVYVVVQDAELARQAFTVAQKLRRGGLSVVCELPTRDYTVRPIRAQFGAADRAGGRGAHMALVFGTVEDREGLVGLKDLTSGEQRTLPIEMAIAHLIAGTVSSLPATSPQNHP